MADAIRRFPVAPGPIVEVEDPGDRRIDDYRGLNDPTARMRKEAETSIFVVEGKLAVDRLLASSYGVRSLLVDNHQLTTAADLVARTRERGATVFVGSRAVVAATVGFSLHRGVVAVADRKPPADPDRLLRVTAGAPGPGGRGALVVLLEGLNDHENIGALFRNAAAFGVGAVLLDPTCADPFYRRSIRVSVGNVLRVPSARLAPWPIGLERVRDAGFVVAALTPRRDTGLLTVTPAELKPKMSYSDRSAGIALLLGAEGAGLSDGALAASDVAVTISMADGVDSLNVATAAAVALYALAGR